MNNSEITAPSLSEACAEPVEVESEWIEARDTDGREKPPNHEGEALMSTLSRKRIKPPKNTRTKTNPRATQYYNP